MASSIQNVGDRFESFNDLDLLAVICLLAHEVEKNSKKHEVMVPVIAEWEQLSEGYGPGTIELDLDGVVSSEGQRVAMDTLLQAVEGYVRHIEGAVPASVLNSRCRAPGVKFFDYPVASIVSAIHRFRRLIGNDQN